MMHLPLSSAESLREPLPLKPPPPEQSTVTLALATGCFVSVATISSSIFRQPGLGVVKANGLLLGWDQRAASVLPPGGSMAVKSV